MKDRLLSRKTCYLLLAAAMGIGCWGFAAISSPLYIDTDNYWIATVVNGLYSRDTYTVFLHPFLCWFLGLMARLLPTADVYTLTARILLAFGVSLLAYLALEHGRSLPEKLAWLAILPALTRILWLWTENFTVHAAFFTAVGLLAFSVDRSHKHTACRVIGILYICMGLMWRKQAAEIFIPFALLVFLARVLGSAGSRRKYLFSLWRSLSALAVCVAILLTGQALVDRSEKYLADYAYNYGRSHVQDFPMRSWSDVQDEISPDITESEYKAAINWILFDTENLNAEKLERIGIEGAADTSFDRQNLAETAVDTLRSARWMGTGIVFLIALSVLLLAKLVFSGGSLWYKLAGLFAIVGGSVIIVYFTYTGRAPARIWEAVLLAQVTALVALCASVADAPRPNAVPCWCAGLILVLVVYLLGKALYYTDFRRPQPALTARTGYDEVGLTQTFQGDDLYVWKADGDTWYYVISAWYEGYGKLPSQDFFDHNICTGNWLYGQHYYNEYFERLGASNPADALLNRPHTYFVADDTWPYLEYLQAHYGEDVTAEQIGKVAGVLVWQFSLPES